MMRAIALSGGRGGGFGRINTVNRGQYATVTFSPASEQRSTEAPRQSTRSATIRPLVRRMAAPRGVTIGQMDRNGSRTPPDRLVSTFDFLSYSKASSSGSCPATDATREVTGLPRDTRLQVKEWEGRVVFSGNTPWSTGPTPSRTPGPAVGSPSRTPQKQATWTDVHGSSSSPISISSTSSPEQDLPRPRVRAKYTPLSSTAYTPPRPIEQPKPVHPFFQRDFRRSRSTPPPPAVHRPRMVAHYSSTSVTESSQSSQGSWKVDRRTEVELVSQQIDNRRYSSSSSSSRRDDEQGAAEHRAAGRQMEEINAMLRDLELNPAAVWAGGNSKPKSTASTRKPLTPSSAITSGDKSTKDAKRVLRPTAKTTTNKTITAGKSTFQTANEPKANAASSTLATARKIRSIALPALAKANESLPDLPIFSYRHLASPPKVVYTRDVNEANDLLECVTGNVIGFDLEWPTKAYNSKTRRYDWTPGKTALMQIGDERLVVLMHVWHMPRLPIKAIEMLMDKSIYKLGVQIRGDEAKLGRDYPDIFQNGIESTVDLSHIARRADPIATGPGNTLIALNTLARTYLGKELDKGDVRRGDWSKKLDTEQIEYAANDVASSIEIYKALLKVARSNNINIDLADFTAGGSSMLAGRVGAAGGEGSPSAFGRAPPGVAPREWNALNIFKSGLTLREAAAELSIKETTVHSYVASALSMLPENSMTTEQKVRFLDEIPQASYLYKQYPKLFRRLREETAQTVSDTETDSLP